MFQLLTLGLTLEPHDPVTGRGVAFDLLTSAEVPVTTGHAGGVITLDLAESDDVHRERIRTRLSEPYRTLIGHFRHEIGHYEFTVLVGPNEVDEVRSHFGDERADYAAALERHYRDGAPPGWADTHVSEYATMHPSEDFAETFAHYLHLRAVLDTAAAYGLRVDGPAEAVATPLTSVPAELDPDDFAGLVAAWLPLSYALNAVSRSIADDDLYPFVLPAPVIAKLAVVHRLVRQAAASTPPQPVGAA